MYKTLACLLASIFMYCCYIYTLPAAEPAADVALAASEMRVTARITLPAMRLYAVSLGTYDMQEEARIAAARYSLRGAAGCIVETEDGWALLGAGYDSDGDAASVCRQLKSDEGIAAQVVLFSADELQVSMTASQSQADAIRRALELLDEIPDELAALAAQVDSGQCTSATARSLISVRCTDAVRAADELTSRLGNTADVFSRTVETEMQELCEVLAAMTAEDGPGGLLLSSMMKQGALETELGVIHMMNSLER